MKTLEARLVLHALEARMVPLHGALEARMVLLHSALEARMVPLYGALEARMCYYKVH